MKEALERCLNFDVSLGYLLTDYRFTNRCFKGELEIIICDLLLRLDQRFLHLTRFKPCIELRVSLECLASVQIAGRHFALDVGSNGPSFLI